MSATAFTDKHGNKVVLYYEDKTVAINYVAHDEDDEDAPEVLLGGEELDALIAQLSVMRNIINTTKEEA